MDFFCKICKKRIDYRLYDMSEYAYRSYNKIYCSYSCMRKDQKKREQKDIFRET